MKSVRDYVKNLQIGNIQTYKNMAIAPIIGKNSGLEHIALCDAIGSGFEIREKGSGSVPTLIAVNRTGKEVLAIAGEYIVGGKQNRTLVRNSYFSKDFEGELPVRCVQQGRWNYGDMGERPRRPRPIEPIRPEPFPGIPRPREPYIFEREGAQLEPHPMFRHAGHTPLCASLGARDQGETWGAIQCCFAEVGVKSVTSNLDEIYDKRSEDFENYKSNFPVVENQVGNVAVISKNGNKTLVLDIFDRPEIFQKYHGNLVSSYALEAGLRNGSVQTNPQEVRGFLESVDSCRFNSQRPVSIGQDCKISGAGLQGSTLIHDNNLLYLNLFTRKQSEAEDGPVIRDSAEASGILTAYSTGFHRSL